MPPIQKPNEVNDVKLPQIELPSKLVEEIEAMVKAGWFSSKADVVRLTVLEFIHRLTLLEQFQREDVAWALHQREVGG